MERDILLFFLSLSFLPLLSLSTPPCTTQILSNDSRTLPLKLISIPSILVAGCLGVVLPILAKNIPSLNPTSDSFLVIKSFAAGVILATGMIHILPNSFERLTSPCLGGGAWEKFPFAGFVAMVAAVATMMVDSFAMGWYRRSQISKALPLDDDGDVVGMEHGHGHGVGMGVGEESLGQTIRQRVISQVLELGIVVHSVIIGISLGTSESPSRVRPLLGALSFHQFFEGIGLGGSIVQILSRALV